MKKLFGTYGFGESIVSILIFVVFVKFNLLYFFELALGAKADDQALFIIVFINLILLTVMSLPVLGKHASKIEDEKWKTFFALPEKGAKFTFPVLTEFLGNQALASFLATVLIFTGKEAFASFTGDAIAFYVYVLYVIAIFIGVVSLIRVVLYFNEKWWQFLLVSICSTAVMFSFLGVGLKMAA